MFNMVKLAEMLFMKKKIILVEFIFYIVAYWGRLMVLTFTCAWGCRQKINFVHLILSKTLSHWRCTFNILKFNIFFLNSHISFNKVTLHCSIIKIWFKIFNISIAHY